MLSSTLKLNPAKTDFIIFRSHAPHAPYLPIRIFGNFMHTSVVVKNLGVCFDANFSFVIMSAIFVRPASFTLVISGRLDSTSLMRLQSWQLMS